MKVNRKTMMMAHHDAILEQAGKLFCERGLDGVTVAEISGAAGLTHGAFYGHFASKTALAAEACRNVLEDAAKRWRRRAIAAKKAGEDPVAALIDDYLTLTKCDSRDPSYALASLGPEASRDPDLLRSIAAGALALVEVLAELIAERRPDESPELHQQVALAALAAMSGGRTLARALAYDVRLSTSALEATAFLAKRAINRIT
jgi:TetR/AcrR family transcriptional regulator, transcriptional repressor for nem operon